MVVLVLFFVSFACLFGFDVVCFGAYVLLGAGLDVLVWGVFVYCISGLILVIACFVWLFGFAMLMRLVGLLMVFGCLVLWFCLWLCCLTCCFVGLIVVVLVLF